jgi:hypothetical protein
LIILYCVTAGEKLPKEKNIGKFLILGELIGEKTENSGKTLKNTKNYSKMLNKN